MMTTAELITLSPCEASIHSPPRPEPTILFASQKEFPGEHLGHELVNKMETWHLHLVRRLLEKQRLQTRDCQPLRPPHVSQRTDRAPLRALPRAAALLRLRPGRLPRVHAVPEAKVKPVRLRHQGGNSSGKAKIEGAGQGSKATFTSGSPGLGESPLENVRRFQRGHARHARLLRAHREKCSGHGRFLPRHWG
ncbi:hypothetical protein N658DRAFT_255928 [Parathielavia hyrcaniae]|uniref:Uncharacterized protein n=1 Tax=Parathielavia hyrcaniae TaxID=113614 RepID=A0AAN6SZ04_9PEZI|nr:hypothetical protein N658DRAFT_255928 [Parathielavia hyrcaniae]